MSPSIFRLKEGRGGDSAGLGLPRSRGQIRRLQEARARPTPCLLNLPARPWAQPGYEPPHPEPLLVSPRSGRYTCMGPQHPRAPAQPDPPTVSAGRGGSEFGQHKVAQSRQVITGVKSCLYSKERKQ